MDKGNVDLLIRRHTKGYSVACDIWDECDPFMAETETYLQALCQGHAYIEDLIKKETKS